jgi:hypothetical protein
VKATPIDRAFMREVRGYPWTIFAELSCDRPVEPDRLAEAAATAARHHPMCRVRPAGHGDWVEAPPGPPEPPVVLDGGDLRIARESLLAMPVDLDRPPPFTVALVREPAGDRVVVLGHHAAMDGVGLMRLIRSLAAVYGDPRAVLPPDAYGAFPPITSATGRHDPDAVDRARARTPRRTDQLHPDPPAEPRPGYVLAHEVLPASGATLALPGGAVVPRNDVVVAATHRAIAQWNEKRGASPGEIAVSVTVNLRPRRNWDEGIGNRSGAWLTTSDPRVRADAGELLGAVSAQCRPARFGIEGREVASVTAEVVEGRFPRWPRAAVMAAVTLSNLGDLGRVVPERLGAAAITGVLGTVPPVNPRGLSVVVWRFAGVDHVAVRGRADRFDREGVDGFAGLVLTSFAELSS